MVVKSIEPIALNHHVCACYNEELQWHCQRFSNNNAPVRSMRTLPIILATLAFACSMQTQYPDG